MNADTMQLVLGDRADARDDRYLHRSQQLQLLTCLDDRPAVGLG
jgi:hypothetical protein